MALKVPAQIDAALRAEADQHLLDCHLCPHHCGTERMTADGLCRVGAQSYIASEMLHMGEESALQPAHAIFLSGCTARCTFCTAAKFAFVPTYGVSVSSSQMARRIQRRQAEGARSICFIGGDPVPHIPFVLATIAALGEEKQAPVIFNSNFYLTDVALDLLQPAIDIFLPDLKFGPELGQDSCAERLGAMPNYWPAVTGAIDRLYAQGERLIVRHLLMPGHLDCCTMPILAWVGERPGIQLSLLTQYVAPSHIRGEMASSLAEVDIESAQSVVAALGIALAV